jgi:hypothetical protein
MAVRLRTMKKLLKSLAIVGVAVLGFAANGKSQVQQSISFSLTVYNQSDTGVRAVHITNRDIIENMTGTNVAGAKLWVIMPDAPTPDANDNIGAFLRVTDSKGNVLAETTSDTFNIYQHSSSQTGNRTYAWNQFSIAIGALSTELYGTATWSKSSQGPGGLGSFHCSVSGSCELSGVTSGSMPCTGSVSGGSAKAAQ